MFSLKSRPSRQRGQWTMISMLVAVAIILILAAMYLPRIAARHSAPGQAMTPREKAYATGCTEYLAQMNQAVSMYKIDNNDRPPSTIADLKKYGVTDEMINAPECSYQIDPQTGAVSGFARGRALPGSVPSATPNAGYNRGLPPSPPGMTRGPGGINIPTGAGPSSLPNLDTGQ